MMNISELKNYLYNLGGASRGLDNFSDFLAKYDNPQNKFKCIHVLGTNGKGSTTAILEKLLENKFCQVATFTSPALIDVFDRIQINRTDICEDDFTRIFNLIYKDAKLHQLGFFEILTAIAFIYFAEQNVNYAIIEAGVGGKHDCTSVINAQVRLLTNVGYDHVDILGASLEEILIQKLGACKPGDTLITTINEKTLKTIAEKWCEKNSVSCLFVSNYVEYELNLLGSHQKQNASLAYECCKVLQLNLTEEMVKNSFKTVCWRGRFEKIAENAYIDGAHNIDGIYQSLKTADQIFGKKNYNVISSILKGKDVRMFNKVFNEHANKTTFTTFEYLRAYTREELLEFDVNVNFNLKQLIDEAINSNDNYLFTGSLYFITEIIKYLNNKKER